MQRPAGWAAGPRLLTIVLVTLMAITISMLAAPARAQQAVATGAAQPAAVAPQAALDLTDPSVQLCSETLYEMAQLTEGARC